MESVVLEVVCGGVWCVSGGVWLVEGGGCDVWRVWFWRLCVEGCGV